MFYRHLHSFFIFFLKEYFDFKKNFTGVEFCVKMKFTGIDFEN